MSALRSDGSRAAKHTHVAVGIVTLSTVRSVWQGQRGQRASAFVEFQSQLRRYSEAYSDQMGYRQNKQVGVHILMLAGVERRGSGVDWVLAYPSRRPQCMTF